MINLTNPGITVVDNAPTIDFNRANAILKAVNTFRYQKNAPTIEPTKDELAQSIKAFETSSKAFTGGSSTTGSGLTATNTVAPIFYSDIEGGAFIKSGISYMQNVDNSYTLPRFDINGGFVPQIGGTSTVNEISTFADQSVALQGFTAVISGNEDTFVRNSDPAAIIATFEAALNNQKLILSDTLIAAKVTASGSGAIALPTTGVNTYGFIHLQMYNQIGFLGKYANEGTPTFYMTHAAYMRLVSEQDNQGRFLDCPYQMTKPVNTDGSIPVSGLVAYFGGYPIMLVGSTGTKGILSTYTVATGGSGVISAQTGGTSTAVIYAVPKALVLVRGKSEYDQIQVFNGTTDRDTFLRGEITVGARTYMGTALWNPLRVSYFTI